ncbi:DUF998 domain-containing protein [Nonomuraea basaltis]|uniref:DUF998 domain-containing protein n=1 Tax=Nonomuraea basaltis TaxID=2495887 RepID=UPI00110C65BA|nr:DUF998 domain-containing protein [Nonomuraea basaltis]TMR96217.1 DUF998 domain-containing protein [Nonomuraea basaltis]
MRTITSPGPDPGHGQPGAESNGRTTRRLLLCGAIAGPLFVVAFLIQGATRAHYDPLRHPVSSLALGEYGWVQTANFILTGVLTLAFAVGLRRALKASAGRPHSTIRGSLWGPILVGVWGAMLVGAGLFTTDPVSGYPPGTPDLLVEYSSLSAELHDLLSLPGFVAIPIACVVFAVRFARTREVGWVVYSAVSATGFVLADVLASMAFGQNPSLVAYGGLVQRLAVTIGWAWLTLLAVRLLRRRPSTPAPVTRR